jgi:hypothetical protein
LIFWDQDGVLLIDYLPKDQTIKAEYYSSLLVLLKDILKEKCHGKIAKGVLFLCDNAPAHRALANPSDYHLFPGLKKTIQRSPFFVRREGHCCRGDLVGRTTF